MYTPTRIALAAAAALVVLAGTGRAQGWPEIYDPLVLRTLNLQMSNQDWQTIQHDQTFDIWVPTMLWLDGEAPILVAVRRKSADALSNASGFLKVSYKIDINEYVSGQDWHDLRALSLDNGDDENVVSEGLAWYLHRAAAGPEGYGYDAGLASWVRLVINGVDTGVYVSAEQRDKRFLQNRGLWIDDETWLYEVEDLQGQEMDEGGPGDSPLVTALCYSPFASPNTCPTPDAATLASALPPVIDMQGLLTLAAVGAFSANPDAIFSHGKNFYFVDYLAGQRRVYLPWDLDSALSGGGANADIYALQSHYSQVLLNVPAFRAQYSHILNALVCGPFREARLHDFLAELEPVLSAALEADPNNQLGGQSVAEFFEARRDWFSQRVQSVQTQIEGFVPCGIGASYCGPAVPNSTGSAAEMHADGSVIAASNDVMLMARALPLSSFGYFLTSRTQSFVPGAGGSQGNLCLGGSIGRYVGPGQVGNSGSIGSFALVLELTQHPTPTGFVSVVAGENWSFQAWYRDSIGGVATSNFTDGLEVGFQ
jgi:hypothetical protein